MGTIEELKRDIEKERNKNRNLHELRELGNERYKLEEELKKLKRENDNFGKKETLNKVGSNLKKLGSDLLNLAGDVKKRVEVNDKKYKGGLGLFN